MSTTHPSRRALMARLMVLVGASATTVNLNACMQAKAGLAGEEGLYFDRRQMAILADVADIMIPKTDTPGALEAGVPEFIDYLMTFWAGKAAKAQLPAAIATIDSLARTRFSQAYHRLPDTNRLEVVTEVDRMSFDNDTVYDGADDYKLLKKLIFLGYRTSEVVFRHYVPNPGVYKGDLTQGEYDALVAERSVGTL